MTDEKNVLTLELLVNYSSKDWPVIRQEFFIWLLFTAVKFTCDLRKSLKVDIVVFACWHIYKTKSIVGEQSILINQFVLYQNDFFFDVLTGIMFNTSLWIKMSLISRWWRFACFFLLIGFSYQILFQVYFG